MSALSNYYENVVINHLFRAQPHTPPGTIYLALFTSDAGLEANNPTEEVGTDGTAYARQVITLTEAVGGSSSNAETITWLRSTAGWGEVTHWAIVDHPSNVNWGVDVNVMIHGEWTVPQTVVVDKIISVDAGALVVNAL